VDCRRSSIGTATLSLLLLISACQETGGPSVVETKEAQAPVAAASRVAASPDILQWVTPDADLVAILSKEPAECKTADAGAEAQFLLGRLAFRSPFLLGGQAARNGLTCQACHSQGQVNDNFFVLGMSDKIGTADVTNFHFSKELGDDTFNPAPIPSLSDDVFGVDYSPDKPDLEALVLKLITKEFSGKDPNPDVLQGILSYIRALDDEACPPSNSLAEKDLLDFQLENISRSFALLSRQLYGPETQSFIVVALRAEIGSVYKRFPGNPALSQNLADLGQSLNERTAKLTKDQIVTASKTWASLEKKLKAEFDNSLYSSKAIQKWIENNRNANQ